MKRRDFLTIVGLSTAALSTIGCVTKSTLNTSPYLKTLRKKQDIKTRVVIVGGGFGGLNTASSIKQNDPENKIEVIVLEKNSTYFVCPMSNTLLSGDKSFKKEDFVFNYNAVQREYNFEVIQTEVMDIDRKERIVYSSQGTLNFDYLVLAPGIDYNYEVEFPTWSQEKIKRAKLEAPGGLISDSGVEHAVLLKQLRDFKARGGKGNIIIIPPRTHLIKNLNKTVKISSLMRCKPAAYERACMIGDWIKRNNLVGKATVTILDSSARPQAKAPAFEQVFEEKYEGIIEYLGASNLMDVDFDKKIVYFRDIDDDAEYIKAPMSYEVLNLMPLQKASSVIKMANIATNSWGGAKLKDKKMYSITDDHIFIVGDSAFFKKGVFKDNPKKAGGVPAAAQTAYSLAKETGKLITQRILENKDNDLVTFSASCFSMVSTTPNKLGIGIQKDFTYDKNGTMIIQEKVPKIDGKYYNSTSGEGLLGWFEGVTSDTFAKF